MADQKKRIIDLSELSQEVQEGQYILVDSAGGTGKMNLKKIVDDSTTSLTERVTDLETDLTEEENARSAADTELSGWISDLQTALAAEKQAREEADEDIETALDNKAEKDGYYPSLYAGNLTSTRKQTDSVPYLMRKTGGDLSRIGEREDDTLVGATVNVNQLYNQIDATSSDNGLTCVRSASSGEMTLNGTTTAKGNVFALGVANVQNHVYALFGNRNQNLNIQLSSQSYGADQGNGVIIRNTSSNPTWYYVLNIQVDVGTEITNLIFRPQIIDLTAYFGSTIADYLYSLETATAGAGIAKLREWGFLTDEYIPHNPGSLESVEATAHKTVGFNQWDEEWETGVIKQSDGSIDSSSSFTNRRTTSFIRVIPNTTYYLACPQNALGGRYAYYDIDKNLVEYNGNGFGSHVITTPNNAHYLRISIGTSYGTTYNNDICINLSNPDRNGEYEPYSAHTYDLGTDTLRGLFKLDSNNELYADGDTKTSDGTVTRKYGVVDLGTLNYSNNWGTGAYDVSGVLSNANAIIAKYSYVSGVNSTNMPDKTWTYASNRLFIKDTAYNSTSAFKTAMSGVMLVYELATPTTEQSTPFQNPQICDPDGTEEYVTSNGVPVGHETEYDYDIKGLAEGLIDVPDVPSTNGTYVLKATRTADGLSYNWVTG